MRRHPDYSGVQVEIHDRSEELYDAATPETDEARSEARSEFILRLYVVQARAYLRLVDNMQYQDAYEFILRDNVQEVWSKYAKVDRTLFGKMAGLDMRFLQTAQLLVQHWITEGHRRIAKAKEAGEGSLTGQPGPSSNRPISQREEHHAKASRKIREPNPDILKNKETVNHREAAEALGIDPRTVNRWIADKILTPTHVAGRNRFKSRDLLRIINQTKLDKT